MNESIIFAFPENKVFANYLAKSLHIEKGNMLIDKFPDKESYIRINSNVKNKVVILFCTLNNPDRKIMSLMFVAQTLKKLGAKKIILISPYLPYMRQDKCFKPGEAVTSQLFAQFVSGWVDYLMTIDPHLHRIHSLSEIYPIPVATLHATHVIAQWIKKNIQSPCLIGPDIESKQWVLEIAEHLNIPFIICNKTRISGHEVVIDIPSFSSSNKTLIIVDDIISSGSSMLAILQKLTLNGSKNLLCLAVHPLLNNKTKNNLLFNGAKEIITCNTVRDSTNRINILNLISNQLNKLLDEI